jgi:hypothetical protein
MRADILAAMAATARDGAAPRVNLNLFERRAVERVLAFEPDHDALDAKLGLFVDRLNDSPAWGAYFAGVGDHFDHGAARARRHISRIA